MSPFLSDLRDQLLAIWSRLGQVQRIVLVALGVLTVGLSVAFLGWSRTPDYRVAYTGIDEADAARIVEKLQERQIPYKFGSNGSILVPSTSVHEVRLAMAAEGLPTGGSIGFELFDGNMFGMTEFSQEVNYRRALEGELARTVSSLASVEQARVHLVLPKQTLYTSRQAEPSGSIMVKLAPGSGLSAEQVRSIRFLVAGSIENLKPENLTIVDTEGNTLAAGGESAAQALSLEVIAAQMQAQLSYERALEAELSSMLERLVGPGRAVVRVSAEMDWDKVETLSEIYAPDTHQGVLRSAFESSEVYSGRAGPGEGGPAGFEANTGDAGEGLPEVAKAADGEGGSWERRESTHNYEISRQEQRVVKAPGSLRRVTVSALIDGVTEPGVLADIQDALSVAAGLSPERGDTISVKALPFDRTYYEDEAAAMERSRREQVYWSVGKMLAVAVLGVIVLIYLRSIVRTFGSSPSRREGQAVPRLEEGVRDRIESGERGVLVAPDEDVYLAPGLAERVAETQASRGSASVTSTEQPRKAAPGRQDEEGEEAVATDVLDDEEEYDESDEARRARERIERQVLAIARTEPHELVQVLREWMSGSD